MQDIQPTSGSLFSKSLEILVEKKEVCSSKDNLRTPELPEDFLEVLLVSVKLFPRNPSSKHMKGADCPPSFPNYLQAQYYRKISV